MERKEVAGEKEVAMRALRLFRIQVKGLGLSTRPGNTEEEKEYCLWIRIFNFFCLYSRKLLILTPAAYVFCAGAGISQLLCIFFLMVLLIY